MSRKRVLCAGVLAALVLWGCSTDPTPHADQIALRAGLQRETLWASPFLLTAYVRLTRHDRPLQVYIEGDGMAWRHRNLPSDDPTPRRALGLRLAAADPAANVVYLARPCQFTPRHDNPLCQPDYWTAKRFAPEVIAAMNQAVSHYYAFTPGQALTLNGYSGGGAVAVLVAARRQDVTLLRTVAGNLDPVAVNQLHAVSPMPESLNPQAVTAQLVALPQLHFSGEDDRIVPPFLAQAFADAIGRCAAVRILPGLSHEGDWAARWPTLLRLQAPCQS